MLPAETLGRRTTDAGPVGVDESSEDEADDLKFTDELKDPGNEMTVDLALDPGPGLPPPSGLWPLPLPKECTVLRAKRRICRRLHPSFTPSMLRLRLPDTRGGGTLADYEDVGPSTSSGAAAAPRERTLASYGIGHDDCLSLDLLWEGAEHMGHPSTRKRQLPSEAAHGVPSPNAQRHSGAPLPSALAEVGPATQLMPGAARKKVRLMPASFSSRSQPQPEPQPSPPPAEGVPRPQPAGAQQPPAAPAAARAQPAPPPVQQPAAPASPQPRPRLQPADAQQSPAAARVQPAPPAAQQPAASPSPQPQQGQGPEAAPAEPGGSPGAGARAANKRDWKSHEVNALLELVRQHGPLWAKLAKEHSSTRLGGRDQRQLRDKFRNMVRTVRSNVSSRGNGALTEDQRHEVLEVANKWDYKDRDD